jgi:hypothetical protein
MIKTIAGKSFGAALLALVSLSACVETTAPGTATVAAATPKGIEPVSGIATDALVAVSYMGSERFFVVFYEPGKINSAQKAAAPEKLCASRGLKVSAVEDKPLEHPEEMPGAMKLVVRCK